jgi:hypothetical protein
MRARRGLALGAALALALVLAGCGSSDNGKGVATAGGTPSAAATQSNQDKALKYVACVRSKGIDIGDPENGEVPPIEKGTVSESALKAAVDACRQYLPPSGKKGPVDAGQVEKLRQLAKCMRDNGVRNFPDPDPDQGGISLDPNSGMNVNDPTFKAALQKCNHLATPPSGRPGSPSGGQGVRR